MAWQNTDRNGGKLEMLSFMSLQSLNFQADALDSRLDGKLSAPLEDSGRAGREIPYDCGRLRHEVCILRLIVIPVSEKTRKPPGICSLRLVDTAGTGSFFALHRTDKSIQPNCFRKNPVFLRQRSEPYSESPDPIF